MEGTTQSVCVCVCEELDLVAFQLAIRTGWLADSMTDNTVTTRFGPDVLDMMQASFAVTAAVGDDEVGEPGSGNGGLMIWVVVRWRVLLHLRLWLTP